MTTGGTNPDGMSSSINVTPLIDVLLVLLIIFMVIVPLIPKGEFAQVPKAAGKIAPVSPIVLEVLRGRGGDVRYRINGEDVARQHLAAQLAAIYANRAERVLFVMGDDSLGFIEVAQAIDLGHAAGADRVGLITPGMRTQAADRD